MTELMMIEDYKPSKVVIGKINEKFIKFYYPVDEDNFSSIRFQIPKMKITFDIEKKESGGRVFCKNINLSTNEIGTDNNKKRIRILRKRLKQTEEKILELIPSYLKSKTFTPSLWQGKNEEYSPTFKVSMNFNNSGETKTAVFKGDQNTPVSETELSKGQVVSMSIKLDKLWIWNDKIGLNWEIEQVKICEETQERKMGMLIK